MPPSRLISISVILTFCFAAFLYFGLQTDPRFWTSVTTQIVSSGPSKMTMQADKFTPEVLLGAPRRSSAVPDPRGTLAVFTVSTYSFESHEKTTEVRVIDISSGHSTLITSDSKTSEPNWLGGASELLWPKEGERGATELVVGSVNQIGETYVAGTLPGSISNVKLKALGPDKVAIAFTGKAWANGTLYNKELEAKKYTTARLYDRTMVRHWDEYVTPQKDAVWYGVLEAFHGKWSLQYSWNALEDTELESPIPTFGGKDHFDISSNGLVFVAKDPELKAAFNTKGNFYYLPIPNFHQKTKSKPQKLELEALQGAASSPVFSSDGKSAAFLQMAQNGYESDRYRMVHIPRIERMQESSDSFAIATVLTMEDQDTKWDRSPSSVSFSPDGTMLLLVVEDQGDDVLFKIDLTASSVERPQALIGLGAISDVQPLKTGSNELFISSSSLIDNSIYTIVDPAQPAGAREVSSNSRNGAAFGLSSEQVSDIWFKGAGVSQVHALVVKPSNFSEDHQYPLAYLIHGGPQVCRTISRLVLLSLTSSGRELGRDLGQLAGIRPSLPSKATS